MKNASGVNATFNKEPNLEIWAKALDELFRKVQANREMKKQNKQAG
jgi:hypothetical protein